MVMATQNPVEHEGTYPLPEAQVDRFLLKVVVTYPTPDEELAILDAMATSLAEARRVGRSLSARSCSMSRARRRLDLHRRQGPPTTSSASSSRRAIRPRSVSTSPR